MLDIKLKDQLSKNKKKKQSAITKINILFQ